jgi:hypothetical protein
MACGKLAHRAEGPRRHVRRAAATPCWLQPPVPRRALAVLTAPARRLLTLDGQGSLRTVMLACADVAAGPLQSLVRLGAGHDRHRSSRSPMHTN